MQIIPKLYPYKLAVVRSGRIDLAMYRPLKGQTIALAIGNAWRGFDRQTRYYLNFELDEHIDVDRLMKVLRFLGLTVKLLVRTQHGYHVYTDYNSTSRIDVYLKLYRVSELLPIDQGQVKLAWKRICDRRYDSFIFLRVSGKYAYNDLEVIYKYRVRPRGYHWYVMRLLDTK